MSAITGAYAPAGQGWRLAYSLVTLAHELADKYGDQISCLGTLGNAAHVTEGYSSDHNPFIRDPAEPSIGIVRAIDLGGDPSLLLAVRQHVYDLAGAGFPPLTPYGYLKGPDSQGTPWPCGKAGFNHQPGDEGHLHISVTQVNGYSPNPNGYVAAIDSTAPWGFTGTTPSGDGSQIVDQLVEEDEDMAVKVFLAFGKANPKVGYIANAEDRTRRVMSGAAFGALDAMLDPTTGKKAYPRADGAADDFTDA